MKKHNPVSDLFLDLCRYGSGKWAPELRKRYNLIDAITRHTVQVSMTSLLVWFVLHFCHQLHCGWYLSTSCRRCRFTPMAGLQSWCLWTTRERGIWGLQCGRGSTRGSNSTSECGPLRRATRTSMTSLTMLSSAERLPVCMHDGSLEAVVFGVSC